MTQPDAPFALSLIERHDPLFLKLKTHYERRLMELRAANDNPQDAEKTAYLRGRILEAKLFLFLDQETPVIE